MHTVYDISHSFGFNTVHMSYEPKVRNVDFD